MKLISWNVNGIRSVLKKGFADFVQSSGADLICLQETRAAPDQVQIEFPGYTVHWNPAQKKGYAGTAILSRIEILSLTRGMEIAEHDQEGRLITAELKNFYLVTVYTPNSQHELTRLAYRTRLWDPAFRAYLKKLEKHKPVIFCGDLNVAHQEIDLANPKSNRRNAGFTDEERGAFDSLLAEGFVDTFRVFCKEAGHYTWWSNFGRSRERNIGWRIDYFCVSEVLRPVLKNAGISSEVMGSDHCPVWIEIQPADRI